MAGHLFIPAAVNCWKFLLPEIWHSFADASVNIVQIYVIYASQLKKEFNNFVSHDIMSWLVNKSCFNFDAGMSQFWQQKFPANFLEFEWCVHGAAMALMSGYKPRLTSHLAISTFSGDFLPGNGSRGTKGEWQYARNIWPNLQDVHPSLWQS